MSESKDELSAQEFADLGIREDLVEKLRHLQSIGHDPFEPIRYEWTHKCGEARDEFSAEHPGDEHIPADPNNKHYRICGRVMVKRDAGKAVFADLVDQTGRMQLHFKTDELGSEQLELIKHIDPGDLIGVEGLMFRTQRGEITLRVLDFRFIGKNIRTLPDKHKGLSDPELRVRLRYLDILMNPEVSKKLKERSMIMRSLREYMDKSEFFEIETPVLQPVAAGVYAKPFITHFNALDQDMYLRVSQETFAKRMLVAGWERVYEVARVFRNEGVSFKHNPEFTLLEYYWLFADYENLAQLCEGLFDYIAKSVYGTYEINIGGDIINFKAPYPRYEFTDLMKKYTGKSVEEIPDLDSAIAFAKDKLTTEQFKALENNPHYEDVLDELFTDLVAPNLIQPTFVTHHPTPLMPFVKKVKNRPYLCYGIEIYIKGVEVGAGGCENVDPFDQRRRFAERIKYAPPECRLMDDEYLKSLEYGLACAAGFGVGLDRMIAMFTGSHSLREIIIFPHLRTKLTLNLG